jgi:hypothetical protein
MLPPTKAGVPTAVQETSEITPLFWAASLCLVPVQLLPPLYLARAQLVGLKPLDLSTTFIGHKMDSR